LHHRGTPLATQLMLFGSASPTVAVANSCSLLTAHRVQSLNRNQLCLWRVGFRPSLDAMPQEVLHNLHRLTTVAAALDSSVPVWHHQ